MRDLGAGFVVLGASLPEERARPAVALDLGESLLERFPWLDQDRTDASARVAAACVNAFEDQLVNAGSALMAAFAASPSPVRAELAAAVLPGLRSTHAVFTNLIARLERELELPTPTQH